jgi:hypothetical protein
MRVCGKNNRKHNNDDDDLKQERIREYDGRGKITIKRGEE